MMLTIGKSRDERGQASMVTVAMFMILFAVVAVGFTFIVVSTARQATNDSIYAAAKAAADSGVEDAKRLLTYCYNKHGHYNTSQGKLCGAVIGKTLEGTAAQDCATLTKLIHDNPETSDQFAVQGDGSSGLVGVGGSTDSTDSGTNNEYYQCLKIATRTDTYSGLVSTNTSAVIPLKLVDGSGNPAHIGKIVVSWHKLSSKNGDNSTGDGTFTSISPGDTLPEQLNWRGPAVLRIERANVDRTVTYSSPDDLVSNDVAVTMRPSSDAGISSEFNLDRYKSKYNWRSSGSRWQMGSNLGPNTLIKAKCESGDVLNGNYACSVTLTDDIDVSGNNDYFLRLNAIYQDTHFSIQAYDDHNNKLYFDNVQPVVDVTGRSADSFSRVLARIKPKYGEMTGPNWYPEYAIESPNGQVCKNMEVEYGTGKNSCD